MNLTFVSDLHIADAQSPLYRSLVSLIKDQIQPGDTLVLGGDIFDLFVGNNTIFKERFAEFLFAVRTAGMRGAHVIYIEGNHDFLLSQVFEGCKGVRVEKEHARLDLAGKRFYLAHGDLVNARDFGYRALRAVFRSLPMRLFVSHAPGTWVDAFGRTCSGASKKVNRAPDPLLDSRRDNQRAIYREFAGVKFAEGYDFIVMGHTHVPDECEYKLGDRVGQYINIGYPPENGTVLRWSEGAGKFVRVPA